MDQIKSFVAFAKRVYNGNATPKDILSVSLQKFTRITLVWFNVPDWRESSILTRGIHYLISSSIWLLWILVTLQVTQTNITRDNFVQVCGTVSFILGGTITMMRTVEHWRHRERLTTLLDTINRKVQESRLLASDQRNQESNLIFLFLSCATIGAVSMSCGFCFAIFCKSVFTGERYFTLALPVDRDPYSLVWWSEVGFIVFGQTYCALLYSLMDSILIDPCLQLAFLFRVQYDQILSLSNKDKDSTRKFVTIVKELVQLKKLTADYMAIIWAYQFYLWSVSYFLLGLGALCLVLEMENGIMEVLTVLLYPSYVIMILTIWSFVGTYFEESATELNPSLYNSNWTDLPLATRKMIVILMTFGQRPPCIQVAPFYDLNREALAGLLKKTYQLIAVVRNLMRESF